MDLTYPIKDYKPKDLYQLNEKGDGGFYPIGANNFWHGGVHFATKEPIRAIADGEVIAYRITEEPLESEISDHKKSKIKFSNSFVLVRHRYTTPKKHEILFYAVYMHLLPLGKYSTVQLNNAPSIFQKKRFEVITSEDGKGLNIRAEDDFSSVVKVASHDSIMEKVGDPPPADHWSSKKPGYVKVSHDGDLGYAMIGGRTKDVGGGKYKVTTKEDTPEAFRLGLNVREAAKSDATVLMVMPKGSEVEFKNPGAIKKTGYYELSTGGFIYYKKNKIKATKIIEPDRLDVVVSTNTKIKKGEIVGYAGPYLTVPETAHFEIFLQDIKSLSNSKRETWGPTKFEIPKGTTFRVKEPIPNSEIQVNLLKGGSAKLLSEGENDWRKVSVQDKVRGWTLKSGLDYKKASNSYTLKASLEFLEKKPVAGAAAADRIRIDAPLGATLKYLNKKSPDKLYREVEFTLKSSKEGWAKTADLRPYKSATNLYTPKADLPKLLTYAPYTAFKFEKEAGKNKVLLVLEKSAKPIVSADDGKTWLEFAYDGTKKGWLASDDPNLRKGSDYDWHTWERLTEKKAYSKDGFCDVDLFMKKLDLNKDKRVTVSEIKKALQDKDTASYIHTLACVHPTEWDNGTDEYIKKWERLKKAPWRFSQSRFDEYRAHFKHMQWWDKVKGLPSPSEVWHVHPVGFIRHLRDLMGVTADQLKALYAEGHRNKLYVEGHWVDGLTPAQSDALIQKYLIHLNETMARYEINTRLRQVHFLTQVGHESARLRLTKENLGATQRYAPYFGRGLIQLTWEDNYRKYNNYRKKVYGKDDNLVVKKDRLSDKPEIATDVSGWFWRRGVVTKRRHFNLNDLADKDEGDRISASINWGHPWAALAGVNGLADRRKLEAQAKEIFL